MGVNWWNIFPVCVKPRDQSLALYNLGMVAHMCDPRTWEVRPRGSEVNHHISYVVTLKPA